MHMLVCVGACEGRVWIRGWVRVCGCMCVFVRVDEYVCVWVGAFVCLGACVVRVCMGASVCACVGASGCVGVCLRVGMCVSVCVFVC